MPEKPLELITTGYSFLILTGVLALASSYLFNARWLFVLAALELLFTGVGIGLTFVITGFIKKTVEKAKELD